MNIRGAVDKYDRETSGYIVAYLDILGVTSRMSLEKECQIVPLNKLYNLYKSVIELTEKGKGIEALNGIEIKIFSDNIIIARKLSPDCETQISEIKSVLNCASHFLISAIGDAVGWLVRGGITIGDFYINDVIVWGPALLRAYELESSIGIYPRVVIDSAIIPELKKSKETSEYILLDTDGIHFLNYMSIWHFAARIAKAGFEKIKTEAVLRNGRYSDKIYQKLFWHMNYVNNELDKKNEPGEEKYRLTLE